ncbi:uncharacterized protein LOC135500465 isoform X2 [Lineus longissimus]|uniref:uncharacterized protein LOC135500465 isoform X2 n=1 Tax=Lineus longissimus TaxID=88925 RepID=UPI002B4EB9F9
MRPRNYRDTLPMAPITTPKIIRPFAEVATMSRRLTKDECDLILQGAVVLACGGGGPLNFARYILDELDEDDMAVVESPENVGDEEWMTMIALVGTPSKVQNNKTHTPRPRSRRTSPWGPSPQISPRTSPRQSPRSSPRTSPRSSPATSPISFKEAGNRLKAIINKGTEESESPKPSFYELVKHVMRVKFLCTAFGANSIPEPGDPHTPNNAAKNTFLYLQKQCQLRSSDKLHYNRYKNFDQFSYILTGELGAVNMATALYLSAINGVAVVDCDGAGRSVPLVNQITYADKFTVSPTAIMSPQPGPDFDSIASTLLDFPCGTEKMVEEVAAALIADENGPFHPYIGYGTYVITGEQMGDVPVFGSYTIALEVGKAMNTFYGEERALTISQVLTSHGRSNIIAFHGYVTEKVLQNNRVKDTGYLVITDIDNSQNTLKLWYKNEIILAGRPGESPSFMAPDSICILPAHEGPMDISSIPDPASAECRLEVFILIIQADDKIKNPKVVKSFESIYKLFKCDEDNTCYDGDYKPWCKDERNDSEELFRVENVITVHAMPPTPFRKDFFKDSQKGDQWVL